MADGTPASDRDRIPALDGLRGIAILLVLLAHVRFVPAGGNPFDHWLSVGLLAGYSGVDLFFVLSGFLITGVLLDAKRAAPQHALRTFYARRALRILPLYYGVVAALMITHPSSGIRDLQWWYWLHLTNVGQMLAKPWHGPGHFWSLAVEEQFYFVWPFLVLYVSERRLLGVSIACCVLAFVLRATLIGAGVNDWWIYVLPFTRMDTLLAGAALAVLARRPGGLADYVPHAKRWAPVAGLAFLTLFVIQQGFGRWDPAFRTIGYTAVVVLFASTLVLAVAGPLARPLRFPLLRFFGVYSYGIYVFHELLLTHLGPLYGIARQIPRIGGSAIAGEAFLFVTATTVTVAVAYASWHLYERPFLALKRFVPVAPSTVVRVPERARRPERVVALEMFEDAPAHRGIVPGAPLRIADQPGVDAE